MQENNFELQLPDPKSVSNLSIDEEYFWLIENATKRKLRLHDYHEVYQLPYLYEQLMEKLDSQSHQVLTSLLVEHFVKVDGSVEEMAVLDIGAGSGLVGHTLAELGVLSIIGLDIVPEAKQLAITQYPGVYQHYFVEDLCQLSAATKQALKEERLNCLICCSALSRGHVPAYALKSAFNAIALNGWIAFNVAEYFWKQQGEGGFIHQHPWVTDANCFEMVQLHPYRHRFYTDGRPLDYVAIIGRKRSDLQ